MYKLGQILLLIAVLGILAVSILLFMNLVDTRISGGVLVLALIFIGAGSGISKKYKK